MKSGERVLKEVVTVTEMARMVGLSRARFYELSRQGVFAPPSRNPMTDRPFYSREQQERCQEIRRTHRGDNGRTILFYSVAPKTPASSERSVRRPPKSSKRPRRDSRIDGLREGLVQLGMREISEARIRAALAAEWPDGQDDVEPATLLTAVYRSLKRRNTPDNVAR